MARLNCYNLLCIIYVTLGSFFYGYDSGCTTSILGYPAFINYFNFNSTTLGALGSVYYGGNFIGNFIMLYIADRFGRLRTIQVACVISLLGVALQTGAQNQGMLFSGRVIGGIACGIIYSVCPLYASEISPPEIRGRVGGLYRFADAVFWSSSWSFD
jgi:MFS family permease